MIITGLEIQNFGKLYNQKIDFKDGINIIYGENETGKSTIHTFVRAMLFGIDRQRGRASKNNIYTLYEPWENPVCYEGRLWLEIDGESYQIHRRFQKNQKACTIVNENTGEDLTQQQLLELLGGITENGFQNTVSIGQLRTAPDQGLIGQLQNTAANLQASGSMEWDVVKAFAFLKEQKKQLGKRYQPGLQEQLKNITVDLEALDKELEYLNNMKEQSIKEEYLISKKIDQMVKEGERVEQKRRFASRCLFFSSSFFLAAIICYLFKMNSLTIGIFGILALVLLGYSWLLYAFSGNKLNVKPLKVRDLELKKQIQKAEWQLEQMKEKASQYQQMLEHCEKVAIENEHLEQELSSLQLAEQTLHLVLHRMQKDFGGMLNKGMSEILFELTDGKYEKLKMDSDGSIFILDRDRKIFMNQVSKGCLEQIYIAVRLQAIEIIAGYKEMPILFDDAFVLYDDKRLTKMLKYLSGSPKQILLFTCQQREEEILKKEKISFYKIWLSQSASGKDIDKKDYDK